MHKLDPTTHGTIAPLTLPRAARAALILVLTAGTTGAFAQDSGLGAFANEEQQFRDAMAEDGITPTKAPAKAEPRPTDDLNFDVSVDEYDLVDLHVNNEDLGRVLQLLSIQSQRNIIASNNVDASVTADLYGVTFYDALDAILHVNGFGYIEKGNFIYVYTREELEQIEQAARTRESRVFQLNYLNATDAGEFAKSMLSDGGSIVTNAATEDYSLNGESPSGGDQFASSATVVVHDYPENIEAIGELFASIDTKPVQVLVEATILQTTLNEANAFGVDFAILNNMDFTDFVGLGGPLSAVNGLISGAGETVDGTEVDAPRNGNGSALNTNIGNVSGPATFKAGIVNEDVAIFLRVLDQVTDITVVSNPKILTLNRQPARVLVGTKVGYLNTTTTQTATTQSVEFLDTGTQLAVRPFVSDTGLIRLELKPEVSSAQLREVTDNGNNTVTIPDEDSTELTTNIMLRDGQTAVLGGLFTEITTASRRQVPLLGDIPIIGSAFRGNEDSTRRSEIIFLVTPSIVNDTILDESGQLASKYVDNARVGARIGTLPFSRDRRVGRLLIEARRLADAGETERAIFKAQQAISLSPMSADARVLLEELTGEKHRRPSRSVLEGALHRELLDPMPGVVSQNWKQELRPFPMFGPSDKAETPTTATASTGSNTVTPAATTPVVTTQPGGVQVETITAAPTPTTTTPDTHVANVTPTDSNWSTESDQIEIEPVEPQTEGTDVVNAEEGEPMAFNVSPLEDIDWDEVNPEPATTAVATDEDAYQWTEVEPTTPVQTASSQTTWSQPTTPSTSDGSIRIESLNSDGQVVQAEAGDWGDESWRNQNWDDNAWDQAEIQSTPIETVTETQTAEQTGGKQDAPKSFDPLAMTADELASEYQLEPLEDFDFNSHPQQHEAFNAPASDVLDMITGGTTSPTTTTKAQTTTKPVASQSTTPSVTTTSTTAVPMQSVAATRGGFLVVPVPGGGVVQIPWPMQQSAQQDGVKWREFTSVPVDRIDENAFNALDR